MNESEKILWELFSNRMDKIEDKVDSLNIWKAKMIAYASVVSFLGSLAGWALGNII